MPSATSEQAAVIARKTTVRETRLGAGSAVSGLLIGVRHSRASSD